MPTCMINPAGKAATAMACATGQYKTALEMTGGSTLNNSSSVPPALASSNAPE